MKNVIKKRNLSVTAKEELRYENTVWNILIGIALIGIVISLAGTVKEAYLFFYGSRIEASYNERNLTASYFDENHKFYFYDLSQDIFVHPKIEDGRVSLYYKDNIADATFLTTWQMWVMYYAVFIALGAVAIWRRRKNIKERINEAEMVQEL